MQVLLYPPIALLIYAALGFLLTKIGQKAAPPEDKQNEMKLDLYAGGEEGPKDFPVPGYKPFLLISLFFAIIHIGVLVVGMSNLSASSIVYIVVLMIGLIALMLG